MCHTHQDINIHPDWFVILGSQFMDLNKHHMLGLKFFALPYCQLTLLKIQNDHLLYYYYIPGDHHLTHMWTGIIITRDDSYDIAYLNAPLACSFHMKNLEPLTYFIGLEVRKSLIGIQVHQ